MLNSILAWVMKTDVAIKLIEKWSFDYIKMECAGEKCYGVLAVRSVHCRSQATHRTDMGHQGASNLLRFGVVPFRYELSPHWC